MAIGDIVGTLSVAGASNPTFVLTFNPGGLFAVSGSSLVQAVDTPSGEYSIVVKATAPGISLLQPFLLTLTLPPPGTGSSLDFSQADNSPFIL